jgi:hypothetical protein
MRRARGPRTPTSRAIRGKKRFDAAKASNRFRAAKRGPIPGAAFGSHPLNPPSPQQEPRSSVRGAIAGGLIAGTVDIGAASLIYWRDPGLILRTIASGVLGPASFTGGTGSAALGLGLQWAMSLIIAAIYLMAASLLPFFRRAWVRGGLLAGAVTFVVMNYVVLPLSAVGRGPRFTAQLFLENLLAMFLFGLIIAFFVRQSPSARGP